MIANGNFLSFCVCVLSSSLFYFCFIWFHVFTLASLLSAFFSIFIISSSIQCTTTFVIGYPRFEYFYPEHHKQFQLSICVFRTSSRNHRAKTKTSQCFSNGKLWKKTFSEQKIKIEIANIEDTIAKEKKTNPLTCFPKKQWWRVRM